MKTNCGTDSANRVEGRRDLSPGAPLGAILVTGLVLLLTFATRFSPAQTPMELMRWKEFSYAKQTNQLGTRMTAIDGVHRAGYIVLGDGQFARVWSSFVHTSSPEGKEFYQGFVTYDFNDGSSILAKADVSGEPRSKQTGTLTFLAGTKRFKGITGRGTVSSWMPTKWDMYAEVEASYAVAKNASDASR
jgi:hypothetical protein